MRPRSLRSFGVFVGAVLIWATMGGLLTAAGQSITIGAVQTTEGPLGPFGKEIDAGMRDAIDIANSEGGINGKPVTYVMKGGTYKPKDDRQLFEQIVAEHKPLIMYGNSTELSLDLASEIKDRYRVLYSAASFSFKLAYPSAKNSPIFVSGPTYGDQFGILLRYIARKNPGAKVAFLYSDTEFGRDPIKFGRLMVDRLRLKLVKEVEAGMTGGDISSQVRALKEADPDYVILNGFLVAPVPEIIRQSREMGMKCVFMGTFWGATKLILDKLGPLAEGYLAVNPYAYWWMDDVPMIKKIKAYTAKKYPEVQFRPIYYMHGFVTGQVFVEVLKRADRAGQLNYEGLVKEFQALKDFDTGGLTPPLTNVNNRFPVARVWRANPQKGIFEPEGDWVRFYLE